MPNRREISTERSVQDLQDVWLFPGEEIKVEALASTVAET